MQTTAFFYNYKFFIGIYKIENIYTIIYYNYYIYLITYHIILYNRYKQIRDHTNESNINILKCNGKQ